jgi:hypothetical protein
MLKTITAIVAIASIAAAALVTPKPAEASCLGCRFAGGVGGAFASPFPSPFASGGNGYAYPVSGSRAYSTTPYAYAPAYYAPRPGYVRHYERQYIRRYY